MNNSKYVAAIRAVCEIYGRAPLSEVAARVYFEVCGIADEAAFIQALFDWMKAQSTFPLPSDIAKAPATPATEAQDHA